MSRPKLAAALLLTLAGAAGPSTSAPCGESYRVVRGDTLYRISRRCGCSVASIARASGVRNPNRIYVGQRLVIPRSRTAVAASEAPRQRDDDGVYRMARGDTLYSLARWSRTSLPALLAANPGIDPRKIEIGDAVRLPAGATDPERLRARERGIAPPPPPPPPRAVAPAPAPPRVRQAPPPREADDKPPPWEYNDEPPTREDEPEAM